MRSLTSTFIYFGFVVQLFQLSDAQLPPACLTECETFVLVSAGCAQPTVANTPCLCTQTFLAYMQTCLQQTCVYTPADMAFQILQSQCAGPFLSPSSTSSISLSTSSLTTFSSLTTTSTLTTTSNSASAVNTVMANPIYTPPPQSTPPQSTPPQSITPSVDSSTPPAESSTAMSGGSTTVAFTTTSTLTTTGSSASTTTSSTSVSSSAANLKGLGLSTILAVMTSFAVGLLFTRG